MVYDPEWFRQRYLKNRDALLEKSKARYWANKDAKREYDKKRRIEMAKEIKATNKKRRTLNMGTARALFERARYRAARDGLQFNIEIEDIVVPECCPVLGIKLSPVSKKGGHHFSPSLDRIVPSLGYVKGNIAVISRLANSIKRDGTPEQVMKVALWYKAITSQEAANLETADGSPQ
jgi:hypothetical protein